MFLNSTHGNGEIGTSSLTRFSRLLQGFAYIKISSDFLGIVQAREKLTSHVVQIPIFKCGVTAAKVRQASLPRVIPAAGLSQDNVSVYANSPIRDTCLQGYNLSTSTFNSRGFSPLFKTLT